MENEKTNHARGQSPGVVQRLNTEDRYTYLYCVGWLATSTIPTTTFKI